MTLWGFYGLVFKRAWNLAFARARRFGFWVAPVGAMILFLAWIYLPPERLIGLSRLLPFAALASVAFLILNLLWLLIRAPYELHGDVVAALETATRSQMDEDKRRTIRQRLADFVLRAQEFQNAQNSVVFATQGPEMRLWVEALETYITEQFGKVHLARFRQSAPFDCGYGLMMSPGEQRRGLAARLDFLVELTDELS